MTGNKTRFHCFRRRLQKLKWLTKRLNEGKFELEYAESFVPYVMEAVKILPYCQGKKRKAELLREAVREFNRAVIDRKKTTP